MFMGDFNSSIDVGCSTSSSRDKLIEVVVAATITGGIIL